MITLLSATPGGGKTCHAITEMKIAIEQGRPLFVHGVPGLLLPHEPVFCRAPMCKVCKESDYPAEDRLFAEDWHIWAPVGAFLVFDEVQNIYRPRGPAVKPPDSVMAFETHRHSGLDFLLITQKPKLVDSNVRALVGKHIHLKANWAKRVQIEWPECQENPAILGDGVKSNYKLDKSNWGLYKSAEEHTTVRRKIPPQVFIVIIALVVAGVLAVRTVSSISARATSEAVADGESQATESTRPPAAASSGFTPLPDLVTFQREPAIPGIPESAPAYSHLVEIRDYPRLAACTLNAEKRQCNCYTQQGTVYPMTYSQCAAEVESPRFNPYKAPVVASRRRSSENAD